MSTKIAFASCCRYRQGQDQPAWDWITAANPDLLLLLGDNVYMTYWEDEKWDMAVLHEKYRLQKEQPRFAKLIANKDIAKLAIWDDHDFGMNNACGDENHAEREGSLAAFRQHMDFLANPDKTKVYCSYEIGDVKVIMLDVRFYRQRVKKVGDAVTLLGDEQTDWLWKELHHDKKFTVIGSGSTIAEGELGESVQDYQPFYGQLADRLQALGNVLFLSGDIHYNRFNDHWIERSDPTDPKGLRTIKEFGFFEATSSGVSNQVFREAAGKWVDINNWGLLTFDEKEVLVDLYRGKNQSRTKIDIQSWKVIKN